MTEQEIMQLARDAGFSTAVRHTEEDIIRFATLVAEREREACIEDVRTVGGQFAAECEAAIRARGGKGGEEC